MRRRTVTSAAATFVTLLVISGCATGPTATELDHGNSVRHMVQAQTLNPAGSDDAPVDETDSSRTSSVLGVYRGDVSMPKYNAGGTGAASSSNSQQR
jgi:hypothetical protein